MTTKIVGFQSGHDVAYCILENGIPIIHEEKERITRKKMEYGDGLEFYFKRNKKNDDINYFTFANVIHTRRRSFNETCYIPEYKDKMNKILTQNHGGYYEFGHHLAHSANAFYTSDFDKALIISIDGAGYEEGEVLTSMTIDEGIGNRINRIKIFDFNAIQVCHIYNNATKCVFCLSVGPPKGGQEGTIMAMASLGQPKYENMFYDYGNNRSELARIVQLSEQEKFNVAASLQLAAEKLFYSNIKNYVRSSNHENLCLSGGVSLNCVMVGKIKEWFPQIKNIFCDPVPYDAGLALGSARYLWHHVLGNPRIYNNTQNMSPYLGRGYSERDIRKALKSYAGKIKVNKANDRDILEKIKQQKIISVFGGGSESGRRALGNRSILADPRNPEMKQIINEKVKHRQWFRPLAPSILEEKVADWFTDPMLSPYMSFALKVKEEKKSLVPAIVHFDGTARLQTVNKKLSPWYYGFISQWEKMTGVPILINTSFNDSAPIVETPTDAIACFLGTEIDCIYFFEYGILVTKV